ncbi:condensin subunit ScpA [Mycoplasma testudineum]|uniref:Segregation and condensation protein A n=1 Tax=Mycoplasma testudineum TaxID=244584 RepID=A0A4R6IED4_9MOLU|nr:segregation/condensation protein A [Mycoplasma testudineum]OYD26799.1 segregation/condensation protein A [Mycoplasma testudineum]TDO20334.1 condensin subunit ScpA [Mycoplasma testudineum]
MNNSIHNFDISNYSGSLDLLLSLVRDKKVDIKNINLIELADRYLEIINSLQENEIDLASDYLVMAATLLQIKSAMILAKDELPEEIEIDRQAILLKLAEYKAFQEVSEDLKLKEINRQAIFTKNPESTEGFKLEHDESILEGHSNMVQIIIALRQMFEKTFAVKLKQAKFENFTLTPADQIIYIKELFKKHNELTFEMIFKLPSMNHFVITLLALLDLSRKQEIILTQNEQFGTITIAKGEAYES